MFNCLSHHLVKCNGVFYSTDDANNHAHSNLDISFFLNPVLKKLSCLHTSRLCVFFLSTVLYMLCTPCDDRKQLQ